MQTKNRLIFNLDKSIQAKKEIAGNNLLKVVKIKTLIRNAVKYGKYTLAKFANDSAIILHYVWKLPPFLSGKCQQFDRGGNRTRDFWFVSHHSQAIDHNKKDGGVTFMAEIHS